MNGQLEMFTAKSVIRKGCEYARPEPVDHREECIDAVLHSTEDQWVLRELLAGKSWAEGVGGSLYGQHGKDIRLECDAKGMRFWQDKAWHRVKPSDVINRALQYFRPNSQPKL